MSDTGYPNFGYVGPDGAAIGLFKGGIVLDADEGYLPGHGSSPTIPYRAASRISWTVDGTLSGALVAQQIAAETLGGREHHLVVCGTDAAADNARVSLFAAGTTPSIGAVAEQGGVERAVTLISGTDRSSFVRFTGAPGSGRVERLNMGVAATGSFGGAGNITGTIAHGMATTPSVALLTAGDIATFAGGANVPVEMSVIGLSATTITWRARISNGSLSNNSTPIYWLAIG